MCLYFYKISLRDTLEQVSAHKAYNVSYLIPYRKSWLVSSLTTYHLSPGMRTRRKRIYYKLLSIWYLFYPQETKKEKCLILWFMLHLTVSHEHWKPCLLLFWNLPLRKPHTNTMLSGILRGFTDQIHLSSFHM